MSSVRLLKAKLQRLRVQRRRLERRIAVLAGKVARLEARPVWVRFGLGIYRRE